MLLEFAAIAKGYGVEELIDYGHGRGSGLLIASGSGTMMAVMDLCPRLRWCLDIDVNRQARLGGLLAWASRLCSPVCIAGWFSITSPAGLEDAIAEAIRETRGKFNAVIYAAPDVKLSPSLPHADSLAELESYLVQAEHAPVHDGTVKRFRIGDDPVVTMGVGPSRAGVAHDVNELDGA
jgi:hypothetical protein